MAFRSRKGLLLMLLVAALGGQGCATLPERAATPASFAISDFDSTFLGTLAKQSLPPESRLSGFELMPVADAAYAARIELCQKAERTLDLQYYLLQGDNTGKFLMRAARDAALRGVRVRILIDDYYTAGEDPLLASLGATPNLEIRIFNPFPAWRSSSTGRFIAAGADFGRVDHRMHNKLLVADNAMAVAGGRNIADEYFMRAAENNFVDMDVLAAGPVVQELSSIFDRYWNSQYVYPLYAIVSAPVSDAAARRAFEALTADAVPPTETVPPRPELIQFTAVARDIQARHLHLTAAEATAFADPLDKVTGKYADDRTGTVRARVAQAMRAAQQSVLVISPYFVPGKLGLEAMQGLSERGVRLTLITNSLASTDEPLAHGAYIESRAEMLKIGVNIYELSPTLAQKGRKLGQFGRSLGRLHAKVAVIDERKLFVGSMNLDERSERLNTELGMLIDSPDLARQFLQMSALTESAYHLRLSADGRDIEWVSGSGPDAEVVKAEPETSWWLRFQVWLLSDVIPASEL